MKLYRHQEEAALFLRKNAQACLFDEPGVGKTFAALSAAQHTKILVVCPAVAKYVWRDHMAELDPGVKVDVLSGHGSFRWPNNEEMVVVNYDILPKMIGRAPWGTTLIADEAHYLKSQRSVRSRRFRLLSRAVLLRSGRVWLLTGTPMTRDPYDLWSVMYAAGDLNYRVFQTWSTFKFMFNARDRKIRVRGGRERVVIDWGKAKPMVRQMMAPYVMRRTRADVLPSLPVKTYNRVVVDCVPTDYKKELDAMSEELRAVNADLEKAVELVMERGDKAFEKLSQTRKALAGFKLMSARELIESYEEAEVPLVVFSAHRQPVLSLGARTGWRAIVGGSSAEERQGIVQEFQNGRLAGLAATIHASGIALTLTRASDALFIDQDWSPAANSQAEDRVCRIGQTKPVQILRLVADHPVDRAVDAVLARKTAVIGSVI